MEETDDREILDVLFRLLPEVDPTKISRADLGKNAWVKKHCKLDTYKTQVSRATLFLLLGTQNILELIFRSPGVGKIKKKKKGKRPENAYLL